MNSQKGHTEPGIIADFTEKLPGEIWDTIFSYLTWQDLENCHCVNRTWRKRVLSTLAWKQMCINQGFNIPATLSELRTKDTGENISYRELFYRLKYRSDNLDSQFVSETVKLGYKVRPRLDEDFKAVDGGIIAYVDGKEDQTVAVYDCVQQKQSLRIKCDGVIQNMFLFGDILLLQMRDTNPIKITSWSVQSGERICEEYKGMPRLLNHGQGLNSDQYLVDFYDCDTELDVLVGSYFNSDNQIETLLLWGITSGDVLYKFDERTYIREPSCFQAALKLCSIPGQDSFFLTWCSKDENDESLHLTKFSTKSFTKLAEEAFIYSLPHLEIRIGAVAVYQNKLRILLESASLSQPARLSVLKGKEVTLEFRADSGRRQTCFIDGITETARTNNDNMYTYTDSRRENNSIIEDVLYHYSGEAYEVISWFCRQRFNIHVDLYKVLPGNNDRPGDRVLSASFIFRSCLTDRRYRPFVDLSWLDGLSGHNDSGLFLVASTTERENPQDVNSWYEEVTLTSWSKLKLKPRAILDNS